MADIKIYLRIFCTILFVSSVCSSKLNVPRILLPVFTDFSAKFILEAHDGGCYKWTTTRDDLIKLTNIDENPDVHCSQKAEVSTVTKELAKNLAVVLAEDIYTNEILKCDVVIDVIKQLSITTTTRELFMEEIPEAFQVNAYDDQGNEFTTLQGVEFDWHIVSMGIQKEAVIVRYLPFKDSPYEAPVHIQLLEDSNKKGSVILLEGVKTGSAKVSVQLTYPEYKNVPAVEVVLTVIANLLLLPGEVNIMVGDVVSFRLYYMHSGRMDEVHLPDGQYKLECEDTSIIENEVTAQHEVTALALGRSRVLLKNVNAKEDDPALKLPLSVVNVVNPAYIVLTLLPFKNWAIMVGDQHEIIAEVYTSSDSKMLLGPAVEIHTQVGDGFHVEERSRNGSWLTGWGLKESRALVQATLESVSHPRLGRITFDSPIISQAELYIYPRITISPAEVILPWDPELKPKYEIDLVAKGGDGRFLWSSTDHSIGVVTQTGHVRTLAYGHFDVAAAMTRNHHNRQYAKFSILRPVRLEIVEFIMEAEVGQPIYLHVALYAERESKKVNDSRHTFVPFTQCQDLPFQVKQTDSSKFFYNKSAIIPPVGISCGNIAMVGTAVGTTKVTITYQQENQVLEDSVTISAYHKLQRVYPPPEQAVVLAVGSAINLIFTGGPRSQVGRQSDHQRVVVVQDEVIVQAEDVTETNQLPKEDDTVLWVLCRKLGESSVKLMISNHPAVPNCKSLGSILTTKVICGKPRRIRIHPEIKMADPKHCPMDLSADKVVVPNRQDIELDVVVQNEVGKVFLNTSSLQFTWSSKPPGMVKFHSTDSTLNKIEMIGTVAIVNKTQQIIRPFMDTGLLEITGTIVSYKMPVLKTYHITPEWPEFLSGNERDAEPPRISATIGLFLVDNTVVAPNFTVIFNQANAKKEVSVLHGSGYVELSLSNDDVADIRYIEGTRVIEITPKKAGEMMVQVIDLCLIANPVFFTVKVVTMGKIEIESVGKVEINHCIQVVVKLYDQTDQLLDISGLESVELKHRFSKGIANLGRMPQNPDDPWPVGEVHYVLTGVELGDAQLSMSFHSNDQVITSQPVDIQVFPPLRVNPRNGTLLVGSSMQLTLRGGPQPDTNIEFTSMSNTTININEVGLVVGKATGFTRIYARAIGVHPRTGEKIIYAEDRVDVNVITISGIKIGAPLTKFRMGAMVPCWVMGIPETVSPLVLASFEDSSIRYNWYFRDPDVGSLIGVFSVVGVIYKTPDKTIVRITGLQPGKTRLHVNMTMGGDEDSATTLYHAYIDIEVFEPLILTKPTAASKKNGKPLLMARHSVLQLETNLDDSCKVEYVIPEQRFTGSTEISAVNATPSATITITEDGLLQSYGTLGFAPLLITSTDEYGLTQTLTYVVQVKPVHYMLLTVAANWRIHLDSSLQVIPLGTEFDLVANFYDSIGNRFDAGPRQVKVRSNRLDLVKIKQFPNNGTLQVTTKKPGHTVLKGWTDGVDHTADYVRIHTEEVVKPIIDFLTSGDIMCLWSPVVTKHLQVGAWTSSDPDMMSIDSSIDIAFVVGNREGTVLLTHSLHPNAPLRMQVLPIAEVMLIPHKLTYFTNGVEGSYKRIGVVMKSRVSPKDKKSNLIQGWLCDRSFSRYIVPTPFRCYMAFTNDSAPVDASSVYSFKSGFQSDIGQYNCKITSTGANASEISTLVTDISFWVVSEDGEIQSKPLVLPFIPGVYVPSEVTIDEMGNPVDLIVTGLDHVLQQIEVEAVDSSIVFIDNGRLVDANHKLYKVHIVDYHPKFAESEDIMGIIVKSPLTEQVEKLIVKVSPKYRDEACWGKSPVMKFMHKYRHAIIIVISMLIIFCVTCYVYSRYMQPVVNVNVHPKRSLLAAGGGSFIASTPMSGQNLLPRMSPTSPICTSKSNCTCGRTREPVYGDVTSFANLSSPVESRRNRRFL